MPREVVHTHEGEVSRGLGVTGEAISPSEVLARHGVGGNAEVLIAAVREHNPPELQAASSKRINGDLHERLKRGELEYPSNSKASGVVDVDAIAGEGANVMDVAVRGVDSVVYVATDSQGTLYKGTFRLSDPEGTHVSQAELLAKEGSVAAPIVNSRREWAKAQADAADAASARSAELDAREKALAKRERAIMDAEAATADAPVDTSTDTSTEAAATGDAPANGPSTVGLPANYDELSVEAAAAAVEALPSDQREAAVSYERSHKGRKRITGD